MSLRQRTILPAIAALLLWSPIAHTALAAPLDPALQAQLLQIFESYNKAVAAGKVEEALAFRSQEAQTTIKKELAGPEKRKEFLDLSAMMIPDKVEVKHSNLAEDGNSASILTLASKKIPETQKDPNGPPPGSIQSAELTLEFVKEEGQWRYSEQVFGMDPTRIVACKNDKFEPIEAYDENKTINAGGPIVRVVYEADYTLMVIRVLDEETCTFMPNKATIEKAGFKTEFLVPYAIAEIDGYPHKTDKQKIWVDHITVHKE